MSEIITDPFLAYLAMKQERDEWKQRTAQAGDLAADFKRERDEARAELARLREASLDEHTLSCLQHAIHLVERITAGNCTHHAGNISVILKHVLEKSEARAAVRETKEEAK
jgi:hypothetical protein